MNRFTVELSPRRWMPALLAVVLLAQPGAAGAQTLGETRRQATREELEKAAKANESAALIADAKTRAKLLSDAAALRNRLENGDFIPGDRILLLVEGDSAFSDTFTVRGDRMLPLPNLPPITLQGVLDSELEPHLTRELQKYIKQVSLQAIPVVRISLVGFPNSSFYTVPVDQAITDVIAGAGGWGNITQVAYNKTVVRRNGKVLMDAKATADAIRLGKTVGDMALRNGDEIYLPDKLSAGFNWQTVMTAVGAVTGLLWLLRRY